MGESPRDELLNALPVAEAVVMQRRGLREGRGTSNRLGDDRNAMMNLVWVEEGFKALARQTEIPSPPYYR